MITIVKIIAKQDIKNAGKIQAQVILSNGIEKRISPIGNLENNDSNARTAILARGQELFDNGVLYDDDIINIDSPAKDLIDNLPSLEIALNAVDNISNLADAKAFLLKVTKAIYALKEMK